MTACTALYHADRLGRWWYVKLKALTANRDWEGLEAFAKSKKSPIGYEPFVVSAIGVINQNTADPLQIRIISSASTSRLELPFS
jgi:hypothetical protein